MYPIIIIQKKLNLSDLQEFLDNPYPEMIKYTVDTEQGIMAIGGEMHSDSEKILLEYGSKQENIWGANLYLLKSPMEIEYYSLINIRPLLGNRSMEIKLEDIREKVMQITWNWIEK